MRGMEAQLTCGGMKPCRSRWLAVLAVGAALPNPSLLYDALGFIGDSSFYLRLGESNRVNCPGERVSKLVPAELAGALTN